MKRGAKYIRKQKQHALKLEPIEENFDCFEDSSTDFGNKLDAKEHFEALRSA